MHPGKEAAQLLTASPVLCRRTKTDLFVSDLAVKWPGVRHMLAQDQAQAATYVVSLTCALAMQPYKAQVLCSILCLSTLSVSGCSSLWSSLPHSPGLCHSVVVLTRPSVAASY